MSASAFDATESAFMDELFAGAVVALPPDVLGLLLPGDATNGAWLARLWGYEAEPETGRHVRWEARARERAGERAVWPLALAGLLMQILQQGGWLFDPAAVQRRLADVRAWTPVGDAAAWGEVRALLRSFLDAGPGVGFALRSLAASTDRPYGSTAAFGTAARLARALVAVVDAQHGEGAALEEAGAAVRAP